MNPKPFVIKPADRKAALDVLGTQVTVLVSGDDSSDQRITLQAGSEGTGPPPHSHDWDESFFVSGGQIQFTCGGETTMCGAGTLVHVPAGTVHSFSYGPQGGEMIEITGGRSNAIAMFTALARDVPPGSPDAKAIQVLGEHGVRVHL
jgi:mannose-6-phosphate isomerase-like protein (cupin superfamily)